jgi:hypothetical protein
MKVTRRVYTENYGEAVRDNISVQARLNLFLNYFSDFIEDDMYV